MKFTCPFTAEDRKRLAAVVGINASVLYQAMTNDRSMDPKRAVAAEIASKGELMRWHLRPQDWHEIWPELVGREGAPQPAPQVATE